MFACDKSIPIPRSIALFIKSIPSFVSPLLVLFPEPYLFSLFQTGTIDLSPYSYNNSKSFKST